MCPGYFLGDRFFSHLRYSDLRVTSGFAYEDWEFNVQLRYLGFRFLIANNTILFYRQRTGSLLKQANSTSARIIPQCKFFDPAWFANELMREKKQISDWSEFVHIEKSKRLENYTDKIINSPELLSYLLEACRLDPEIDLFKIERRPVTLQSLGTQDHWGFQLADAYRLAGSVPVHRCCTSAVAERGWSREIYSPGFARAGGSKPFGQLSCTLWRAFKNSSLGR